jgi:ATP-binding cassette subfamily C protein CydCD
VSTLVGALASASGVALTATAGWLIVQASYQPAVLTLLVAIVGVRTFGLARPVLRYVERLRSHDVALRLLAERRVQVYDAVVPLTPGRLGRRRGDVLSSIVDDVDSVVDRELRVRMPVRSFLLVSALATVVAAVTLPVAAVVVGVTSVVTGGLGYLLARSGARRAERASVTGRAELSARVVDTTQLAPELVMWQAEASAVDTIAAISDSLGRASARAASWLGLGRATVLTASGLGVAAVALVAAPAAAAGSLSGPMLALLVLLPLALADVALPMADAGALAARTRAAQDRLDQLATLAPAVTDPETPVPTGAGHAVGVGHVVAGWDGSRALDDISLHVAPGERLAVVGPSGSGKSTLAALLLRFIDPQHGQVALGGVPLWRLRLDDVRLGVGLVDDDPHVFATTLVENVRLARPQATDDEVEAALRQARLGPWLDALPDGLHTWVGDGHARVSGGERARIAVARSLLADQPVLVLDEPTAHLDHATATELAHEVLDASAGRSVVWITHDTVGLDLVGRVVDLTPLPGATLRPPADFTPRV